jgi:hypothetical protein
VRAVVDPLDGAFRAARSLQAPQHVQFDPATQTFEVSPSAFKKQSDGTISVDLEQVLVADDLPLDHEYPRIGRAVGLVAHTVQRLTEAGFAVSHDPLEENDYHGIAAGNLSKTTRVALAETCEIIRPLDQAEAMRQREEAERLRAEALRQGR